MVTTRVEQRSAQTDATTNERSKSPFTVRVKDRLIRLIELNDFCNCNRKLQISRMLLSLKMSEENQMLLKPYQSNLLGNIILCDVEMK